MLRKFATGLLAGALVMAAMPAPRLAARPDQDDHELSHHGGNRRQQHGMRAIAREMLARGDLRHPEQAEDDAADQGRAAVAGHADDQYRGAGEDRELGNRQAAERAARTLAVRAQRAHAARPGSRSVAHLGSARLGTPRRTRRGGGRWRRLASALARSRL